MILAGDVGGTKTVLAICGDADFAIAREAVYPCADYPSLEAILDAFLQPGERAGLSAACFGVAGPITDNTSKITNLPWTIDGHAVSAKLGIPVTLINDLQATALGTLILPETAFAVLQPAAAAAPHGSIAVIAPGTGLGTALLISDGDHYRALPSEGGHARLRARHRRGDRVPAVHARAPRRPRQRRARALGRRHRRPLRLRPHVGDRPRVGRAHPAARPRRRSQRRDLEGGARAHRPLGDPRGRAVHRTARRRGRQPRAARLTTGGVVLGGGIPPKLLPALQEARFTDRFNAKGRFSSWTRGLAVRVALEPRAALFGAGALRSNSQGFTLMSVPQKPNGPTARVTPVVASSVTWRDPRRPHDQAPAVPSRPRSSSSAPRATSPAESWRPRSTTSCSTNAVAEPTVIIGVSRGALTAAQFADKAPGQGLGVLAPQGRAGGVGQVRHQPRLRRR